MTDSFFTTRNQFDPQFSRFDGVSAEEIIAASARRLVKLRGPIATYQHLQRIADICATAHLLPIEHWRALDEAPEEEAEPERPPLLSRMLANPVVAYGLGFGICFLLLKVF